MSGTKSGRDAVVTDDIRAGDAASETRALGSGSRSNDLRRESVERLTPKRPSTKALLIDAGERLVGRHGPEGVTLREIAALAGQANSNVVQYHFKDKKGLIEAIFEDRVRRRETLRLESMEALRAEGRQNDPRALLSILWLPTLAFRDEHGEYVFCRFLLQCWLQPDFIKHNPVQERYEGSVLVEIVKLLRANHKTVPHEVFSRRLSALSLMFISCAVEFNNTRPHRQSDVEFDAAPILDMAVAALSAPAGGI